MCRYKLICDDSINALKSIQDKSIDFIFADPPYFLSSGGMTCKSGKAVSVNKADWDLSIPVEEKHKFNKDWLQECKRVLKDDGTIMISGTLHNIYSIGLALEELDYKIINNITWRKTNPPPNLSCRYFTHSTETILWAKKSKKSKHNFNYEDMKVINNNKQMKDVWEFPCINIKEKKYGYHPTQKPLKLMERIILSATKENQVVLDPFCGSGTTGVAALKHNREFIGIDNVSEYIELSRKRIKNSCNS